ncbi:MAG: DMT family transporter, partial [Verrucomicrobiota bacterium]
RIRVGAPQTVGFLMQQAQSYLVPLIVLAGAGIPIMAAINAGLSAQLGSPLAAVLAMLLVATLIAGLMLVVIEGVAVPRLDGLSPEHMLPGLLFLCYALLVPNASARLGLGNAIVLVLLGQLISAALIDQFAMFGAAEFPLTPRRVFGLACVMLGAYLMVASSFK